MEVVVLASKKTYSLAKRMQIVEWFEEKAIVDSLNIPKDFEARAVKADMLNRPFHNEFKEFALSFSLQRRVNDIVSQVATYNTGLTDVAVFIAQCHMALVLPSRFTKYKILNVSSIDELKKALDNG